MVTFMTINIKGTASLFSRLGELGVCVLIVRQSASRGSLPLISAQPKLDLATHLSNVE